MSWEPTFETFAWSESEAAMLADTAPQLHARIVSAIRSGFEAAGLRQDPSQPQLFVTYHAEEKNALIVDTSRLRYGPEG